MKAAERRKAIVNLLLSEQEAISGGALSERFGVSRQIIVQDITVLKGLGYEILSTHNGYIMQKSPLKERVFKLHHTTEQTEDELSLIVGLGGTVVDVFVWHKVYGKVEAKLNIFSDLHVKQFIEGVRTGKSSTIPSTSASQFPLTVSILSLNPFKRGISFLGAYPRGKSFLGPW